MHHGLWWKLEPVSHCIDLGHDGERSIKLEGQLVVRTGSDGRLNIWLKLQKNLVAHLKFPELAFLISVHLHVILGSMQVLLHQVLHYCPFFQPG